MDGAAAGSWIALADPRGIAHAWWGDAPDQIPETQRPGTLAVRWSTTRFELLHWRVVGSGEFAGVICAARSLPAEAPGFARALGLEGLSLDWEPVAPPTAARRFSRRPRARRFWRGVPRTRRSGRAACGGASPSAFSWAIGLWLVFGPSPWIGPGLAILFLGALCGAGGSGRSLASPTPWFLAAGVAALPSALGPLRRGSRTDAALRVVGGYALFAAALVAARRVAVPDLGSTVLADERPFPLSLRPDRAGRSRAGAGRLGGAAVTLARLDDPRRSRDGGRLVVALLLVSASRLYPFAVGAAAALCFEAWRRSIASAPGGGALGPFRLVAGATLLVLLVASPIHEHLRADAAYRVASAIRLPDPERVSAGAVVAVRRAIERVEHFDLARELPAPVGEVDLSDLAYRLWRDGEKRAASPALVAYEVSDVPAPRSAGSR